ncbi:MAG: MATE family efflux transporter [Phycisphaerae bacterium]|nr:MATE family efflux transporter [Phycisphaerae bacterium]
MSPPAPATPTARWRDELPSLLRLAAPNVAATAAETIMSFTDFAIVSKLGPTVGSQAQAAVSSGGMIYFSFFGFLMGVMVCVTTVVSQSLGAGRLRDCSAYAWQALWLSVIATCAGFALWPVIPSLYALIGHEQAVQEMETVYTQIRLLGLGVAGACFALGHFFNGIHQPRHNAYSIVGTVVLNGVLTIALVYGKWGLPALGVAGAAWATVIANAVRLIWLLGVMLFSRPTAPFQATRTWPLNLDKMRRLVRVGLPSGCAFVLDITSWAIFLTVIIGQFGTSALAATAICWRYTELSFMPAVGIGHAVATLVGRSIGAGQPDSARRQAFAGAIVNMLYMGTLALIFTCCGRPLVALLSTDAAVVDLGSRLMIFVGLWQLLDAVAVTYSNALRGAGDTLWPAVVGSVQVWVFMIGGSLLIAYLKPAWGPYGPWALATLDISIVGVIMAVRWRLGAWEHMDVIGRHREAFPAGSIGALDNLPSPPRDDTSPA